MGKQAVRFGATVEEWVHFDVTLGLTSDLLPVVANPEAVISEKSAMKEKGKVPSLYSRSYVVGLPKWTQRIASDFDIAAWMKQPDYGICLQTRLVRALDVDVSDPEKAAEISAFIVERLGMVLPCRWRANSSKCLFAFRLDGDLAKRVIRVTEKTEEVPSQLIEFLANGQQFVAAGTHTSGARILWDWNGYNDFPTLTPQQFEDLWYALADKFGIGASVTGSLRKRGDYIPIEDEVANKIIDNGLDLGQGNDGQIFVACPWKDNHSMDSGYTETAYFPRGSGGYELGHFKCMHAGCSGHGDTDFEVAMGLRDGEFDAVSPEDSKHPVLNFDRNKKTGDIKATLHNLRIALAHPFFTGLEIKYDTFNDDDMLRAWSDKPEGLGEWRRMKNADPVNLRRLLQKERNFVGISREMMRDALVAHGEEKQLDSAINWLEALPEWDGVSRIDGFMHHYFGSQDNDYSRAVGRYLWTALAGRCLVPGIKADMAVILKGEQGIFKSTSIAAMSPTPEMFAELNIGDKEAELARRMRGKLVIELGELRGLYSKEFEAVKAFLARQYDEWIPKYLERQTRVPRRGIFIGTTNHDEFLVDETGNRRFLPLIVGVADIAAIRRDRDLLWAEARQMFKEQGIQWQEAEELARGEHHKFTVQDSWSEDINQYLDTQDINKVTPRQRGYVTVNEILRLALNIQASATNTGQEKKVGKVLRQMGWKYKQKRLEGGKPSWVFINVQ